jgi:hypothetical protein
MTEDTETVSEYASSKGAAGIRVWIDKEITEDNMNEYAQVVIAEDGPRLELTSYELADGEESFICEYKHFAAVPSAGGGALFITEWKMDQSSLGLNEEGVWAWSSTPSDVGYYKPDGWISVRKINSQP